MSEKCCNNNSNKHNNSDNPLTSRRTDGDKNFKQKRVVFFTFKDDFNSCCLPLCFRAGLTT